MTAPHPGRLHTAIVMPRRTSTRVSAFAVVAALLGAAWLFWPAALGGRTAYVATRGVSMEPGFHTGDLAVVRPARAYSAGDVVAYRSQQLDTVVMHRIVAVDGDRYTFKGDNNSWLDPERPARDQLVGRLALRVPRGGYWLRQATGRWGRAVLVFALLAVGGGARQITRRRGAMGRHRHRRARLPRALPVVPHTFRGAAAATAATVGAAGLGLAAVTWTGPAITSKVTTRPVSRAVTFSYTATVPRTAAYDSTTVKAPDPVFRKVARHVAVSYAYQGDAAQIAVTAELSAASGWHSTVSVAGEQPVAAGRYDGVVRLDLDALAGRAAAAAKATGVPIDQLSIAVVPHVRAAGGATFEPELKLVLSPTQLKLADDQKNLTLTDASTVTTTTRVPRTVSLLGRSVRVDAGRRWSLLLLTIAAVALVLLQRRPAASTEATEIHRKYAPLLLPVLPTALPAQRAVVEVAEFDTLVKLAERYGLLVMYWSCDEETTYVVSDESTTYRYRSGRPALASVA